MKTKLAAMFLTIGLAAAPALADKAFDDAVAKAEKQLQQGKTAEARKTLEKLSSQQPANPNVHVAFGLLLQRLGSLDEAMTSMQQAIQVAQAASPADRAAALAALASLELRMAAGASALAHAQEAVAAQATPLALAALARAQIRVGDYVSSLETAERAVGADPNSMAAREARGEALVREGRPAEAVSELRKAIELGPKTGCTLCGAYVLELAKTRLAVALVAQGAASEAVTVAREATEADPQFGEAFAMLGVAILAENPRDPEKWSEAIAQAQQGAFVDPKNPLVRMAVARIFEASGNLQQAEAQYRAVLEIDPAFAPARAALIHAQIRQGDLDGALARARDLIRDTPQSGDAQFALGAVLLRKNDYAGAVGPLASAAKLLPVRSEIQILLGTAYQYTGKAVEAAEAYGRAVALEPANLGYRTTYGLLLGVAEQYEQGITELKKVIETPGYKDTAGYTNLGWIYRNMEPRRPDEAVTAYRRALELDPKNAQAALGLGWAQFYRDGWDEAIGAFQQAIRIDASMGAEAHNGMAWCHYFKKDMAGARAAAAKAKEAGRNVSVLEETIEKYEKAVAQNAAAAAAALAAAKDAQSAWERQSALLETITNKSRNPESRAKAVRDYGRLAGAAGVQNLIWALRDEDRDVRLAAALALGGLGPAAKPALTEMKQLCNTEIDVKLNAPRDVMEREIKDQAIRRAACEAVRNIER